MRLVGTSMLGRWVGGGTCPGSRSVGGLGWLHCGLSPLKFECCNQPGGTEHTGCSGPLQLMLVPGQATREE